MASDLASDCTHLLSILIGDLLKALGVLARNFTTNWFTPDTADEIRRRGLLAAPGPARQARACGFASWPLFRLEIFFWPPRANT